MKSEVYKTAKTKNQDRGSLFLQLCVLTTVLHLGAFAAFGQTNKYLYSGSKVSIPLAPGTYNITAYGAQGGHGGDFTKGGLGAKMVGQFVFGTATNLTILVGGGGLTGSGAGGGGGGTFVIGGSTPLVIAGGGGGCSQDSDAGPGLGGTDGGSNLGSSGLGGTAGSGGGGGQNTFGGGGGGGYNFGYDGNGRAATTPGGYGGGSYLNGGYGGGDGGGDTGGFGGGGGGGNEGGGGGGYSGGGGGAYGNGYTGGGGGGGGSYIDSSAIKVISATSGVASPDGSPNGEVIISAVQVPLPSSLPIFVTRSGSTNTMYWRNDFGWNLQQSVNLTNWTTRTAGITTLNGTNYLSFGNPKDKIFFRLAY